MENKPTTSVQLLAFASFKVTTPEGRVILIDPWITGNKLLPEGLSWPEQIDLILITHGHGDHLDTRLVDIVREKSTKVVANPLVRWYLREQGLPDSVLEGMNVGGTISPLEDVEVTMTNAFHVSHVNQPDGKVGYTHATVGFIIRLSDGYTIYFAADTSVFGDMRLIGEIYRPDLAVLPIGDRFTMGPLEASYAIRLLQVKHVIPCHYANFGGMTGTPEALQALIADMPDVQLHVLEAGESWTPVKEVVNTAQ